MGLCEHNKFKKNCKTCSIFTYLVYLQRARINKIKNDYTLKTEKSSVEYLDCTPEYFKTYIESKFVDGMTFDNIHFDHIKPVSKFNFDDPDELLKCCHYTNFQPLFITDNLVKSNKWSDTDEQFWQDNICYKEYLQLYIPT